jgi:hypothetical protein
MPPYHRKGRHIWQKRAQRREKNIPAWGAVPLPTDEKKGKCPGSSRASPLIQKHFSASCKKNPFSQQKTLRIPARWIMLLNDSRNPAALNAGNTVKT